MRAVECTLMTLRLQIWKKEDKIADGMALRGAAEICACVPGW